MRCWEGLGLESPPSSVWTGVSDPPPSFAVTPVPGYQVSEPSTWKLCYSDLLGEHQLWTSSLLPMLLIACFHSYPCLSPSNDSSILVSCRGWGWLDSELDNISNPFYFHVLADKETAKGLSGSGVRLSTVMYRLQNPLSVPAGCSDRTRAPRPGMLPSASLASGLLSNLHTFSYFFQQRQGSLLFQQKEWSIPTFGRGALAVVAGHDSITSI